MSLKQQLAIELDQFQGGGPAELSFSERPLKGTCDIADKNDLACSVLRLVVHDDRLSNVTAEHLKALSDKLTQRVTYLLEPVGPVEYDDEQCVVQMRSTPPRRDDDGHCYYELLVCRGGDLALARYRKTPGTPREPIPAVLTREVLLRLADDFAEVLS